MLRSNVPARTANYKATERDGLRSGEPSPSQNKPPSGGRPTPLWPRSRRHRGQQRPCRDARPCEPVVGIRRTAPAPTGPSGRRRMRLGARVGTVRLLPAQEAAAVGEAASTCATQKAVKSLARDRRASLLRWPAQLGQRGSEAEAVVSDGLKPGRHLRAGRGLPGVARALAAPRSRCR